jgi:hypothetical protein
MEQSAANQISTPARKNSFCSTLRNGEILTRMKGSSLISKLKFQDPSIQPFKLVSN